MEVCTKCHNFSPRLFLSSTCDCEQKCEPCWQNMNVAERMACADCGKRRKFIRRKDIWRALTVVGRRLKFDLSEEAILFFTVVLITSAWIDGVMFLYSLWFVFLCLVVAFLNNPRLNNFSSYFQHAVVVRSAIASACIFQLWMWRADDYAPSSAAMRVFSIPAMAFSLAVFGYAMLILINVIFFSFYRIEVNIWLVPLSEEAIADLELPPPTSPPPPTPTMTPAASPPPPPPTPPSPPAASPPPAERRYNLRRKK